MAKDINNPKEVTALIQKLEPDFATLIQTIREIVLATDGEIGEQVKWNSPSFFYMGTMREFDPKEYKRDILVIHTRKGIALLVFPTGAVIKDTTGILEGNYSDGRRMITLTTVEEAEEKANHLQTVVKDWLRRVDK
jgi:hypothetical protein